MAKRPTVGKRLADPWSSLVHGRNDVGVLEAVNTLIRNGCSIGELASLPTAELLERARELTHADADASPVLARRRGRRSVATSVIMAVDQDGRINAVSPSIEDLLGWSHTMLVGQPLWGLVVDLPSDLEQYIVGAARPTDGFTCWVWLRTRTGDTLPCRLACGRRRNASEGSAVSITITSRTLYGEDTTPNRSLGRFVSPEQVFEQYVTAAVERHDAALARVWTYNAAGGTLHMRASCGLSKAMRTSQRSTIRVSSYRMKVGVVARTGIPYVHNDLEADGDFDRRWIKKERLQSAAVMPLVRDGELYGVTVTFFRKRLSAADIAMVQSGVTLCEASARLRSR
jgi:PAS domain S-box-containing protein